MHQIYHIIYGTVENITLFPEMEDLYRIREYIRIYKDRYRMEIFAFSFTSTHIHLVLRDSKNLHKEFIQGVQEAYAYFFQLKHEKDIKIQVKKYPIRSMDELLSTLRYLHAKGENSRQDYQGYTRYVKHDILDIGIVLSTLHPDQNRAKELFFAEMVREQDSRYEAVLREHEIFEVDKMTKRHRRAQEFMDSYLKEKQVTRREFFSEAGEALRIELIERFRRDTDLSYRDIGYVFGVSHTSIIRMSQKEQLN